MHPSSEILMTLTAGLGLAALLGFFAHKLRLSPIVGYLLAGIVVSTHTPGYVADPHIASQLAEIGVVLLMFGVGLEFHFRELLAVKYVAISGAVIQSTFTALIMTGLIHLQGGGWTSGLVLGLSVSVASTVVLIRVLADHRELHTPAGHIAVGWLVVEDLFTILILVLLPIIFSDNASTQTTSGLQVVMAVGLALAKVVTLIVIAFVVGTRVIPKILEKVAKTHSRELFTLTILFCALGLAMASSLFFDVSPALGAFFAGMIVGRSEFSYRAAADAFPMRDAFAVLFFVSVGMMFQPTQLLASPTLLLSLLVIVFVVKPLAAFPVLYLMRYPIRTVLTVGIALAQIGEFSFILVTLGTKLGLISEAMTNAIVATAIISITLNPFLHRGIDPLCRTLQAKPRCWHFLNRRAFANTVSTHSDEVESREDKESGSGAYSNEGVLDVKHRAIIVGYGPVGQIVARILQQNHIEPVIIEMNLDTIKQLRQKHICAVYGNAGQNATLRGAKIETARTLILSSDQVTNAGEIIRQVKELNPKIRILARANYVTQIEPLRAVGADLVFAGEAELASVFAESILRELGATDAQMDLERQRIHEELGMNLNS